MLGGVLTLAIPATAASGSPATQGLSCWPTEAGGSTIGPWVPMTGRQELALAISQTGGDPAQAVAEFARNDRNDDGLVCTMTQVLPNDASGNDTWFVSRDNIAGR